MPLSYQSCFKILQNVRKCNITPRVKRLGTWVARSPIGWDITGDAWHVTTSPVKSSVMPLSYQSCFKILQNVRKCVKVLAPSIVYNFRNDEWNIFIFFEEKIWILLSHTWQILYLNSLCGSSIRWNPTDSAGVRFTKKVWRRNTTYISN